MSPPDQPPEEGPANALKIIHLVFAAGELSPTEAWVLVRMAVRSGPRGVHWATLEQITADTKLSPSTVQRTIRALSKRGLLGVCRRKSPGGPHPNLPNVYAVQEGELLKLVPGQKTSDPASSSGHGDQMASGHGDQMHLVMVTPSKKRSLKTLDVKPGGTRVAREAPPGVGPGSAEGENAVDLAGWWLQSFREAWANKYGAPAINRGGADRRVAERVVAAAADQAQAYEARCAARGEPSEPLSALVLLLLQHWGKNFLASAGRRTAEHPEGYLLGRRHPLRCLVDDLEALGTPWAAQEQRQRKGAEQAARQAQEQERRGRDLAVQEAKWRRACPEPSSPSSRPPATGAPSRPPATRSAPLRGPGEAGRMAQETQALRDQIRARLPPGELRQWEALEALAPGERTRSQAQLHTRLSAKGLAAP